MGKQLRTSAAFWSVLGCFLIAGGAHAQAKYSITDLNKQTYTSMVYGVAPRINDVGQVLGPWGIWTPGSPGTQSLPFFATEINNVGQAVGFNSLSSFLFTPGSGISSIGGGEAWSINDGGQVVGRATDGQTHNSSIWFWSGATGRQPVGPPGTLSQGYIGSINNSGAISGDGNVFASYTSAPVPTGNLLGGRLNNVGQVLGDVGVYTPGQPLQIIGPLGTRPTQLRDINDLGQVVGSATPDIDSDPGRAFLWSSSNGLVDLNSLLDDSAAGWVLNTAYDINNVGQIVGMGQRPDGTTALFLLTPVPEPQLVGFGMFFVITAALRRARRI